MAACGICWPHIHTDLPEMYRCPDYRLAALYEFDELAKCEQAVAAPSATRPARAGTPTEHAASPLATPTIFIEVHARPSSRGGVSHLSGRSLPHAVIVAIVFVALALAEFSSWLLRLITNKE